MINWKDIKLPKIAEDIKKRYVLNSLAVGVM